ncbi:MAG: cytochrome c oxidase subunit I, partial [Gammaproteobacteria bacterium]
MSTKTHDHAGHDHGHAHGGAAHDDHDEHHGPAKGLTRWLFTTNHKDIGTLYLLFALVMLFVGGAMAMVIRLELFQPGLQFVNPDFFNQMTT